MKNNKVIVTIVAVIVVVVGALVVFPLFYDKDDNDKQTAMPKSDVVDLQILCVGDVMAHRAQLNAQLQSDGTYSFYNNFKYVKEYITAADVALCNVETTFGGAPYIGYPNFSSPDELATALADAGFDIAITANNHMLDRGRTGLFRTIDVLRGNGFKITGSVEDSAEPRYAMYETGDGVKLAAIAYTYQTPSDAGAVAINGSVVSGESAALINSFSYNDIDDTLSKIDDAISEARAEGADIIIIYYHWGEEYQNNANLWQREIAQKTAEMDVDMIFGSHPHNLQETEIITTETGKQVPVFYSMGNFISNQRAETLGADKRKTETGCMARVFLKYDKQAKIVTDISMDAIPTWVNRYGGSGKYTYAIVPLDQNIESNESLATSGNLHRARAAWEEANGLLGIY
ncbi:MAG: CapA family protein [Eubacteriales bacterium]|nr:CapA family protein [Eubacteriales bacterium]MDD4390883.1 CapA family protein [Eubacteriales bacterium]